MSKLFTFLLILAMGTVYAQCPGPAQRTNLINLQKSQSVEGTLAGQVPFTDECGNQRYGQYVEIENTVVGFIPTATGNTSNFSEFVIASDSTRWYIDWQGRGYLFGNGGTGDDKNGYYGGNGGNGGDATVPSVTQSTLTNQLTFLRATDDAGGLVPIRVVVNAGNEPDFMSFKNLTDSLVIKRSDQDFELVSTDGLTIRGNSDGVGPDAGVAIVAIAATVTITGDSVQIGTVPNNFTGERTFLTQSPGGFITRQEGIGLEDLNFTPVNIYNANGTATSDRTYNGGGFSLAFNNLTTHSETGSGNNTTTTSGSSGDIVLNSGRDILQTSEQNVNITAEEFVTMTSNNSDILLIANGDFQATTAAGNINMNSGGDMDLNAAGLTELRSTSNGINIIANSAVNIDAENGEIFLTSQTASVDVTGETGIGIVSPQGPVSLLGETGIAIRSNDGPLALTLSSGANSMIVTDNSLNPDGLEGAANYCDPTNDLQYAQIICVKDIVSDSLFGKILPPGTIHQTLRHNGTTWVATSEIYNNNSQVSIGTTVFPTRYELNVLGAARINQKLALGNAVSLYKANATLSINDSTSATPSILAISNNSNSIHADAEVIIRSRHLDAASIVSWRNEGIGESANFHAGVGDGAQDWRLCANNDTSLINGRKLSVGFAGHVGLWGINGATKTDAQLQFAAQDDEGVIAPSPIDFDPGDTPDLKRDGNLYYANDAGTVDDLFFVTGSDSYRLGKCLTGGATIDFGNLNPTISEAQAVTVTGAAVGDQCVIGFDPTIMVNGMAFVVYVQAANTARIIATNGSGAAINLASAVYTVRCFH